MRQAWRAAGLAFLFLTMTAAAVHADEPKLTSEQLHFFEAKIRPVLVASCYKCHAADAPKVRGGLLLDSRAGLLQGGDSGPAIVPGQPERSLLIQALRYKEEDLRMPPPRSGGKLSDAVIRDFEQWVRSGAPDPRGGAAPVVKKEPSVDPRLWWAFQPIQKVTVPRTTSGWARTEIDHFIQAELEKKQLVPVADADPLVLLRRVTFDLTGLPPTPAEAKQFLADWQAASDPQAVYAAVVDRLLASPRFGERWGRHWLDVARYAESSGKDVNIAYPHAWRYRDYVIQSLNDDVPFDRFVREQIAGDLLPARPDEQRARNLIATGFLAVGARSLNEMNARQLAVDQADEQIDTVTQAFLGITVACARCHDHKFDPISQRDYTALAGVFLSTETRYGTPGALGGRHAAALHELPRGADLPVLGRGMSPSERQQKEQRLESLRQEQREAFTAGRRDNPQAGLNILRITTQIAQLETELSSVSADGTPKLLAMGVADKPTSRPGMQQFPPRRPLGPRFSGFDTIGDSPFYARGEISSPGERVRRGLPPLFADLAAPSIPSNTSGRLQLADWLCDSRNPLTSRVIVNRVWHWLLGRGLVESVDNFGTSGQLPSHPELLDYLARQFQDDGWSMKRLIRRIVLSRVYQLSAQANEANFSADPDNVLLWRHTPRRLEAEAIRDAILFAAGTLNLTPPTGSLVGRSGDGPIGGPRFRGVSEEALINEDHQHRSVYLSMARNAPAEMLALFDLPDAAAVTGARGVTNVPSQALFFLNSAFVARQAETLAAKLIRDYPGGTLDKFDQRFAEACWLILSRSPTADEKKAARRLLARSPRDPQAGWNRVIRGLFASAEFRLLD
ncbi:MAG TPA: PSD1 and planctomycete cytochrome C domain-containing protein [Gemmatales bacterium]|nr:PSD1 and planctomycete cytochrome C domain-containing protein [Gemmatales bacterium]HMP60359.1 PSD1 and planctomycete cytochrome C domain-containing protein [Gemmatales bacterium]